MNPKENSLKPFIILNSNDFSKRNILAYGAKDFIRLDSSKGAFDLLEEYLGREKSWVFGYLSYDLKNDLEELNSENVDELAFPEMVFFRPKTIMNFETHEELQSYVFEHFPPKKDQKQFDLEPRTSREEYLKNVKSIQSHIQRGDIYELNYCVEYFARSVRIDPLNRYFKLNDFNKAPMSSYFSFDQKHLLCGSPERFLKKEGEVIISQPIKGTIKRSPDPKEDELLKSQLLTDQKERSENIMITDLVRNDLSKTAKKSTVVVKELCKLYSFNTVHQLISTVVSEKKKESSSVDVIKNAWPMGSMTGAPKVKSMELIEHFENFKRGAYSGAVGYFDPDGNFDFNVVIRSLFYDENTNYVSARVGGAITILSEAEKEFEECLLKVESMLKTMR